MTQEIFNKVKKFFLNKEIALRGFIVAPRKIYLSHDYSDPVTVVLETEIIQMGSTSDSDLVVIMGTIRKQVQIFQNDCDVRTFFTSLPHHKK